jgi:hypothetical protein
MAIKYNNILFFSLPRATKIYPNWDFGFENKPSGNPATDKSHISQKRPKLSRVWKTIGIRGKIRNIFLFWN